MVEAPVLRDKPQIRGWSAGAKIARAHQLEASAEVGAQLGPLGLQGPEDQPKGITHLLMRRLVVVHAGDGAGREASPYRDSEAARLGVIDRPAEVRRECPSACALEPR